MTKRAERRQYTWCKHKWEQTGEEFYITEDGMPAKKLIDRCVKCGMRRDR